ncbi:MAG: DUF6384 family protein [Pseudomonadota bacterium]
MNTPAPVPVDENVGLGNVLLAMDVVDTLRHEQRVVSEALGEEAREQALVNRVRRAYRAQGIEVSDALIAEGVAKLKEQQFDYTPPPPGLGTGLAKAWINRGRIGTGLAAVALLVGVIGGGWWGFVERPAQKRLATLVSSTDAGIADATRQLTLLEERRKTLAARIDTERNARTPQPAQAAVTTELDNATQDLANAASALTQAATFAQVARNREPENKAMAQSRSDQLTRQRVLLTTAGNELGNAERALGGLDALRTLPETITTLRDEALAAAATGDARTRIGKTASNALSALSRGEASLAQTGVSSLRSMIEMLQQELEVRIVSRPGVLSGVIRTPNNNRRINNYYLVVEAVDGAGSPARLAIESEEDGTTRTVALWAARVSESTFNGVRRDKQDDGIIQNDAAGAKPRGHLEIDWSLPRSGGFIHTWENPR